MGLKEEAGAGWIVGWGRAGCAGDSDRGFRETLRFHYGAHHREFVGEEEAVLDFNGLCLLLLFSFNIRLVVD